MVQQKTVQSISRIMLAVIILALSLSGGQAAQAANGKPDKNSLPFRTANGIMIQAGSSLPVFKFTSPEVTDKGTSALVQRFSGIYNRQDVQQDTYLGKNRFSVLNQNTNSILEQYGATGGFYAYNATDAFGDQPRGIINGDTAKILTCAFLSSNNLLPDSNLLYTPETKNCDFSPATFTGYTVTLAYSQAEGNATQSGTAADPSVIAAIVNVPMFIRTSQMADIQDIPLGGPGGHISLLFRNTDQGAGRADFSLDDSVPGLSAVAMPFFSRNFVLNHLLPAVDPISARQMVEESVRASFPDATDISIPDPSLFYMVSDAAQAQTGLEPVLDFAGIQVTTPAGVINLKNITTPAVISGPGGYGPTVSITSPSNNSTFTPGDALVLKGSISDGTPPYAYSWSLDDGTPLGDGNAASAGEINTSVDSLPAVSHSGFPAPVVVRLSVEDGDGAVREDAITLVPSLAPYLRLPMILNTNSGGLSSLVPPTTSLSITGATIQSSNYSFGVESGSDYPPYGAGGPDLPGVPPDAGGFRTAMTGVGWNQVFNWANASAWERDWRDCSLGGGDCTYGVDRADFAYWAGHGSNGGIALPSNVNSTWFPGSNARFQRLRWVGFSSCLTLRAQWTPASDAPIRQWFSAFQGAHMLLGFNSLMADVAFGPRLVDNMRMPTFLGIPFPWAQRTIAEAWVLTAFQMNAGKPAYIYAVGNGVDPSGNKLPQPGDPLLPRPYPVSSYHWVWWNE